MPGEDPVGIARHLLEEVHRGGALLEKMGEKRFANRRTGVVQQAQEGVAQTITESFRFHAAKR